MPYCPFCRSEYRVGITHCPDCQVRLVDEAPPPGPAYQEVEEVPVARFNSQIEAEMWSDILRQAKIPSVLVPLGPGSGVWGTSLWVPHELRVRASDVSRARSILPGPEP
jgi:hypothetical protein